MTLLSSDLKYLAQCAAQAARLAGQFIADSKPMQIEHKAGGHSYASQVVTEVDREAERIIVEALQPTLTHFDLGLLTEETEDDRGRLEREFYWCVDPLDGTLSFIEGEPGYAVSLALVSRSGSPMLGVVFAPQEEVMYCAVSGLGTMRDDQPWPLDTTRSETLSVFADRSFASSPRYGALVSSLDEVARSLSLQDVEIHIGGGAVMNACQVLGNAPACYFKFPKPEDGGGSLWDFAATACLAQEAGVVATDIHGAALELNRADSTFMNHRGILFASNEELAALIRALYQ